MIRWKILFFFVFSSSSWLLGAQDGILSLKVFPADFTLVEGEDSLLPFQSRGAIRDYRLPRGSTP